MQLRDTRIGGAVGIWYYPRQKHMPIALRRGASARPATGGCGRYLQDGLGATLNFGQLTEEGASEMDTWPIHPQYSFERSKNFLLVCQVIDRSIESSGVVRRFVPFEPQMHRRITPAASFSPCVRDVHTQMVIGLIPACRNFAKWLNDMQNHLSVAEGRKKSGTAAGKKLKEQRDFFEKSAIGSMTSSASERLKNTLLGSEKDASFNLSAAAEMVSLSVDTLRRAIARGDLVAELVVDRNQEVYQVRKSDLSTYLLFRGLPRREQMRIREARKAQASDVAGVYLSGRPTPLHLQVHSRVAGRSGSVRELLGEVSSQPTALMRGVVPGLEAAPPRSSLNAPAAASARSELKDLPLERQIVVLIETVARLERDASEVKSVLNDLLVSVVGRASR